MGRTYTRHVLLCARVQNFTTIGSHLFLHPHPRNCPVTGLGCGLCLHHHQLKLGNTKTPRQHSETRDTRHQIRTPQSPDYGGDVSLLDPVQGRCGVTWQQHFIRYSSPIPNSYSYSPYEEESSLVFFQLGNYI